MTSDQQPDPVQAEGRFEGILEWSSAISALAAALLGVIFLIDIIGRELFNKPFLGTNEIVSNSMVVIFFMLLPASIRAGAMIRVSIVYDAVSNSSRRVIDGFCDVLGLFLFGLLAFAQWEPMIVGWQTSEFEGQGAFEVPVYPVRTVIVAFSILCTLVHAKLLYVAIVQGSRVK